MADVTDAMLDGYIASFPTTYVRKVDRTSDEMYKACFSACMSSEHPTFHKNQCAGTSDLMVVLLVPPLFRRASARRAVVDWWTGTNVSAFVHSSIGHVPRILDGVRCES